MHKNIQTIIHAKTIFIRCFKNKKGIKTHIHTQKRTKIGYVITLNKRQSQAIIS